MHPRPYYLPPCLLRSKEIVTDPVFGALIWCCTCNFYLLVEELAELIDAEPKEVGRVLKDGDGRRRSLSDTIFLRRFGLIPRPHGKRVAWCSLGIGSIELSLEGCSSLQHVLSAEPKGSIL